MEIRKAHLFFEQSGTFKKAFKNLGIDAEDYDILNEFGETDHIIDLFNDSPRLCRQIHSAIHNERQ